MSLTVEQIRTYCKDTADMNYLLDGDVQSSDPAIELAIQLAVSDFNSLLFPTQFTAENIPSDSAILYGVMHHLCIGEAERNLRNQINYTAQGLSAGIDDKFEQYNRLASFYKQLFLEKARPLKQAINEANAWGEVSSPYSVINEYNYRT